MADVQPHDVADKEVIIGNIPKSLYSTLKSEMAAIIYERIRGLSGAVCPRECFDKFAGHSA